MSFDSAKARAPTRRSRLVLAAGCHMSTRAEGEWARVVRRRKRKAASRSIHSLRRVTHNDLKKSFESTYGIPGRKFSGSAQARYASASAPKGRRRVICLPPMFLKTAARRRPLQIGRESVPTARSAAEPVAVESGSERQHPGRLSRAIVWSHSLVNTSVTGPRKLAGSADPRWPGAFSPTTFARLAAAGCCSPFCRDKFGREFRENSGARAEIRSRIPPTSVARVAARRDTIYIPDSLTSLAELRGLPVKFIAPVEGLPYGVRSGAGEGARLIPMQHGC